MSMIIFSPPVVFIIFLVCSMTLVTWMKGYAKTGKNSERSMDPYACGQRDVENYVNPDYTQFFRYAFVFTVMHVVALVITTAPADAGLLPFAYVAAGVIALVIIFRK